MQVRLTELENQQVTLKSELAEIRTRRKQLEQEPLDPDKAMALFARFAELFEQATAEEKEALADTILKSATVGPDKSVEFEFYTGSDPCNVVQNDKFGGLLLFLMCIDSFMPPMPIACSFLLGPAICLCWIRAH